MVLLKIVYQAAKKSTDFWLSFVHTEWRGDMDQKQKSQGHGRARTSVLKSEDSNSRLSSSFTDAFASCRQQE